MPTPGAAPTKILQLADAPLLAARRFEEGFRGGSVFGIAPLIGHFLIRYQASGVSASLPGLGYPGLRLPATHSALLGGQAVERNIELQHVDARLAKQTKPAAFGIALNELPDPALGQFARLGDAGNLK